MTISRETFSELPCDNHPVDMTTWSDSDLVEALRGGATAAYEQLWIRHVVAARRLARRWAPTQPDDVVSEAFLTIYDQVRTQGKGPNTAFRAYLFAVIRNIAARWYREGISLVYDPDADDIVADDPSLELERTEDGALLLGAFRELPARWQRILWLTNVEDAGRTAIAEELGIRPNAVSALNRRARNGLRLQWLRQHVPVDLRGDAEHVAAELPEVIARGKMPAGLRISQHLATCQRCSAVDLELRSVYRDGRRTAASVGGLAALGVVLPTASTFWVAPVTIAAAAGLGLLGSAAVVTGILTLGLGVATLSTFLRPSFDSAIAIPDLASAAPRIELAPVATPFPREDSAPIPLLPVVPESEPRSPSTPPAESPPEIDIRFDPDASMGFPDRPPPATPSEPGSTPPPGEGADAPEAPTVALMAPSATFLAPVFRGSTDEGSEVAVQFDEKTFLAIADDSGVWEFDVRTVQLPSGAYTATVWTISDGGVASQAAAVPFTIDSIELDGFPDYPSVTLREGMDAGLPFTMTGAPGGSICIESDTGQSATVPLDGNGVATRVLRFYNYGIYVLRLSACDGEFHGPDVLRTVAVTEGIFDPYVLDDVMSWDIAEF